MECVGVLYVNILRVFRIRCVVVRRRKLSVYFVGVFTITHHTLYASTELLAASPSPLLRPPWM